MDYLVEEVLNQQPDALQDFLLQTSILQRMNAPLCNAVTGQTDSEARLEQLARANLFIAALDDQRQWYRYHRLFAEVLRNRLQRTQPAAIPTLHRRAADWCERHGWTAEAIAHFLNAADHTQAARLIDQNARALLKQGQATTLLEWLNKLPAALAAAPQLCVARAWARLLVGPLDALAAALQLAESAVAAADELTDADQRALTAEVHALRVIATVEQGDTSAAVVQLAQQALRNLPADSPYLQSALATALALAHRANGNVQAAVATFSQAQIIADQHNDLFSHLLINYELAELQIEQGQLRQAEARHRQAIQLAAERLGPGARHIALTGAAQIGLGKVLYEWNELAAARQHLAQGYAIADQPGGIGFPRSAAVALAHLHQALGDEDAATAWMTRAEEMARGAPRPQVATEIALHKVRLLLKQGQIDGATAWLRAHGLDMTQVPDYSGEAHYLTLLRVHLAQHERTALLAARAVMTVLLQRAQTQQRHGRMIELYTLQALLWQALGQTEEALRPLEYALAAAEPAGYLRIFVDEGQALFELLQLALARKIKPGYVSRLLAAGKVEQERLAAQQSAQPLVEPLTARELEILTLLANGLSNRALAEILVITIGTVKRHVMNIYGKLGVNSRTQAIAKARQLRLID
ncbi:MAG: LuxR C-terminal-related transcriptional regulator [Caldilineaceae bacterium]